MAWLAGAAGTSGAAGGAAAGAAGSAAGSAGTAAASTGAASAAGAAETAAETAAGAGTSGAATSAAGSAGTAEAAKGIGSSAAKDFIKDTAKDTVQSTINNEINRDDRFNPVSNTFDPSGISSDANNKSNIQSASFQKHEFKKPQKEKLPGVDLLHGFVDGVNDILASDETKKENVTDVSSESSKSDKSNDKPKSSLSRFNTTMKSLGQELGAYAKEEGKNFVSQAIASSAQPQQVNPISVGFTGAQVSSDENLKENIEDAGGIIPMMAQIDSYLYNYKPEAQEEYAGTGMMNNDNNLGVMAQELQENPLTAPAVKTDEKGNLALDTGRLTSINTAMIAELCKKVMELEEQMYGRN